MRKLCLMGFVMLITLLSLRPSVTQAAPVSVTVNCTSNGGTVNSNSWAIGAPDKYWWWAGNANLKTRISDAKIKLVRVGPVQVGKYNGRDMYPSANNWNWTDMDALLNTIWDAGAQPLFIVCGYPAGVAVKDWNAYATFMEGVVNRYNVQKALGASKTIKYWEMWNEPTIEGDGILTMAEYKSFVQTVGAKMKAKDATIKLIGPADAWSDLSATGFVKYTSTNLASYISVLSWHDYGPGPTESDANRMAWTKPHYQDNVVTGRTTFGSFGAAITEYNMSHQDGGATYNAKYHNEFNTTYVASAIINAMKGGAEIFSYYNISESGANLLGACSNTDFTPYKPYYSFYLFGNFTGNQILTGSGGNTDLEYYASKNTSTGKYYITVVNKSTAGVTYEVTVNLNGISGTTGTGNVRKVNSTTNPTSVAGTINYSASAFTYSVPPYNVVNFEVTAGTGGTVPVTGVSVSPTSASIAVNGTQQLAATVLPSNATNATVSWSSSNTTVATVSTSGLVTGKVAGTATITVTTQDGGKTATSAITVTSGSGTVLFQTGFESADIQPTWSSTVEASQNVIAYSGASAPECATRQEAPHAGLGTLMYSGKDNSATTSYCNFKVFDVNIPITSVTKMGYWIYPQQDNGRYVAIDYVCTDGSTLRDCGATDQNGYSMHANAGHGGAITLNAWTQIICNVGQWLNGKTIDRILVDYDRPGSTGDFRGYFDDIVITNGTIAVGQSAPVGINNQLADSRLNIYPNPVSGNILMLQSQLKTNSQVQVNIYNMTGQIVLKEQMGMQNAGTINRAINVTALPQGNYIVKFITGNSIELSQFIRR